MTNSAPGGVSQLALGPHELAQRVPCTICLAQAGNPCLEPDGLERTYAHHSRWIRYQQLMRQRPFTAIVRRKVDERVELGDILLCVATSDPGRLRILADGLGHQERPETIDARAVEFRAFVEDSSRRPGTRRQLRSRPHLGATA